MTVPVGVGAVRPEIATATESLGVTDAAKALYEKGGKRVLSDELQDVVRAGAELKSQDTLCRMGIESVDLPVPSTSVVKETPKGVGSASKQVARGMGRAAGIGAAIDGGLAAVEAALAYQRGEMTAKQALVHVGKEAATGGIAGAAGVALAAGTVALVGTLSAPAVAALSVLGSLATKTGLVRLIE